MTRRERQRQNELYQEALRTSKNSSERKHAMNVLWNRTPSHQPFGAKKLDDKGLRS